MKVEIDENSGFCFGVVNAIAKAEEELQHGRLYCIGDIVHNSLEVERLKQLGLSTIDHDEFASLSAYQWATGLRSRRKNTAIGYSSL